VQPVQLVRPVLSVPREQLEPPARRVTKEMQVLPEQKALKVQKEIKEYKV
jgi:hypothetical protein